MTGYIISVNSGKDGVVYPQILEFKSPEEMDVWLERGGERMLEAIRGNHLDLFGGYAESHILRPGVGDDPDGALDEWLADHPDDE